MSSNIRQIKLLTTELAALERLKHQCLHFFLVGIDPILFKVGGYIDIQNILHEFEFRPNGTTDYGVSCPWASKKLMSPRFSVAIDLILFKLASYKDMHKILDEF